MFTSPFAIGSLGVESLLRHRSLLGALVFRDVYVAARSWEPWRSKLFTPSFVLGASAFEALYAIVRTESLGVQNCSRHRPYGGGNLGVKAVSVTGPCVGLRAHTNVRTGALLSACYVTARSREPWCSEIATLPLALGSLGVKTLFCHRSLLGALVFRDCYVAARSWEPWC